MTPLHLFGLLGLTRYESLNLAAQVAGVLILLAYTIYTARQVKALIASNATNRDILAETRASVGIARDTLILGRRVWLNVEISGAPPMRGRQRSQVFIVLRNVGNMPAAAIALGVTSTILPGVVVESPPAVDPYPVTPLGVQQSARYPVDLAFEEGINVSQGVVCS